MTATIVTEESTPVCVTCGERPWGWGYCGESCKVCAHSVRRSDRLNGWYIADQSGEPASCLYDTKAEADFDLSEGNF